MSCSLLHIIFIRIITKKGDNSIHYCYNIIQMKKLRKLTDLSTPLKVQMWGRSPELWPANIACYPLSPWLYPIAHCYFREKDLARISFWTMSKEGASTAMNLTCHVGLAACITLSPLHSLKRSVLPTEIFSTLYCGFAKLSLAFYRPIWAYLYYDLGYTLLKIELFYYSIISVLILEDCEH